MTRDVEGVPVSPSAGDLHLSEGTDGSPAHAKAVLVQSHAVAVLTREAGTGGPGPDAIRAEYATLVRAAAAGDRGAMERLLMRAQEVAFRFSLLACGHAEDAEDVMQDALLKTYQHVSRIADPDAFRTWLYTTVRNACLMKRRRRAGEPVRFESIEQGAPAAGGEDAPIDIVARPQLSTVAFRVQRRPGESLSDYNRRNVDFLAAINARQRVHLSSTLLPVEDGPSHTSRVCVLSFRTRKANIDACVEDVTAAVTAATA